MPSDNQIKALDEQIERLEASKNTWARLPVNRKIDMLRALLTNIGQQAQHWVDLALVHKQITPGTPYEGEEWSTGPWALAYTITEYIRTLKHIQSNSVLQLVNKTSLRKDGQLKVEVFPSNIYEKVIFSKIRGEVWMKKGVTKYNLKQNMASLYRQTKPSGKVCLVLGAGNINSIPPLDTIYKLIVQGEVVILKMNPVNDYLIPIFKKIFDNFIINDFLQIIGGDNTVGQYLTAHQRIESIHITGSEASHNEIIYGSGKEGMERKKNNKPILNTSKTITSELGSIGPLIVVPGPWNKADIRYQSENIVTAKLHNSGHNCVTSQVLILPKTWDKSKEIIGRVSQLMKTIPYRVPYYPGTAERQKKSIDVYPDAEQSEGKIPRTFITGLDSKNPEEYAFQNEFFGPVFAQTSIEGETTLEYLKNAVQFCNERLKGTLGVTLLIHPQTIKELGIELEDCIGDLKYGAISVNVWSAAAFLLPQSTWGAFPGHTYEDIQSGIGTVRNSLMFDHPEKTVYFGPFRPLPRAFNLAPPRPPWFVTNKTAHITMKQIAKFAIKPGPRYLPGIVYSALKG